MSKFAIIFLTFASSVQPRPHSSLPHEQFWTDPKFFESLTDYLTTDPLSNQAQPEIIISDKEIASFVPVEQDASASDRISSISNQYPIHQHQNPQQSSTMMPVIQNRPVMTAETMPASELLSFHLEPQFQSMSPHNGMPVPLIAMPLSHPNSLPLAATSNGMKKNRRRPNGRRTATTTTTSTPPPTTSTQGLAPEEYDELGDYNGDDWQYDTTTIPHQPVTTNQYVWAYPKRQQTISNNQVWPFAQQQDTQGSVQVSVAASRLPSNLIIATPSPTTSDLGVQMSVDPNKENEVGSPKPGLVNRLSDLIETGRKILYFPKGVVDVVDKAITYAETNPYVSVALGTVADSLFGSTLIYQNQNNVANAPKTTPTKQK